MDHPIKDAADFNTWSEYYFQELKKVEALREKKIKAFDIIKNKGIDYRRFLESKNCDEYNEPIIRYGLIDIKPYTQDEYNLLKEVL